MCGSCSDYYNMSISMIGVGFGFSCFFVFFHFHNVDAGSWALASGVFAGVVFHLHYLHYRRTLDSWHDTETLQGIQFLGVMVMTIGLAGTAWYIFCSYYYRIPILPIEHSTLMAAVWTFMTAKWGLMLLILGKKYTSVIRRENPRLLAIS